MIIGIRFLFGICYNTVNGQNYYHFHLPELHRHISSMDGQMRAVWHVGFIS